MTAPAYSLESSVLAAGLALLRADSVLAAAGVYDGEVPNGAARPYVLVYGYTTWPREADANSLDGRSATLYARWITHSAAESPDAARLVAGRVRAALLDATLTVAGRVCSLIEQESSTLPTPLDKTTGTAVYVQHATYLTRVT